MPGGRPPKPVELKRRLGNPGKRALPDLRPVGAVGSRDIPKAPRAFGAEGRKLWKRVWLVATWLDPQTDLEIVARLAEAHDERKALRDQIARDGMMVEGSTGQMVIHPAVSATRTLETLITKYESLSGLTASDRTRLGINTAKPVSELETFLAKKRGSASA